MNIKDIIKSSKNARFMSDKDVALLTRQIKKRFCITSMTPPEVLLKVANRWKPKVVMTRHFIICGSVRVRMTGLTASQQYAKLWAALGDWQKASKLQDKFNKQFPLLKRAAIWEQPGKVVT